MIKKFIASFILFIYFSPLVVIAEEEYIYDDYPFSEESSDSIADPLEPLNRVIYGFNRAFETLFITPITTVYKAVVPAPVKRGVGNFMTNFQEPVHFVNAVLRLDGKGAVNSSARFLVNSTIGIGGIVDVAGASEKIDSTKHLTFNNTFKYYGMKRGIYLVLPILGSSDIRNSLGTVADYAANPLTYAFHKDFYYVKGGTSYIHYKSEFMGAEKHLRKDAVDEYLSYRSYYDQYSKNNGKD